MRKQVIALLLVLTFTLSGCTELREYYQGKEYTLVLDPHNPDGWNQLEEFTIEIKSEELRELKIIPHKNGQPLTAEIAMNKVTIPMNDGEWEFEVHIAGYYYRTIGPLKNDITLPPLHTVKNIIDQPQGGLVEVGTNYPQDDKFQIELTQLPDNKKIPITTLPFQLENTPIDAQIHYRLKIIEESGQEAEKIITIRTGEYTEFPEPQYSASIQTKYQTTSHLWDITKLDQTLTPSQARNAEDINENYLSNGYGIEPENAEIQAIIQTHTNSAMTTGEIAWELYKYMSDALTYDSEGARDPENTNVNSAEETLIEGKGTCRDLVAVYISLMRGAGVPARVVTGYVPSVDDFHAWAEVYVGGEHPWLVVDVSSINGTYSAPRALASFGIITGDYLPINPLDDLEDDAHDKDDNSEGWHKVMHARFFKPTHGDAPNAALTKNPKIDLPGLKHTALCINTTSLERKLTPDITTCGNTYTHYTGWDVDTETPTLIKEATTYMEYGIQILQQPAGSRIEWKAQKPVDLEQDQYEWATVLYTINIPQSPQLRLTEVNPLTYQANWG